MPSSDPLPSWRQGTTRQAILDFPDREEDIPVERRVAVFDNDGTLWCEKPVYVQLDFFVRELSFGCGGRQPRRAYNAPV